MLSLIFFSDLETKVTEAEEQDIPKKLDNEDQLLFSRIENVLQNRKENLMQPSLFDKVTI